MYIKSMYRGGWNENVIAKLSVSLLKMGERGGRWGAVVYV